MSPPRACRPPGSRFARVRPDSRILGPSGISPSAQRSGSGGASRHGITARPRALKIPPRTSPGQLAELLGRLPPRVRPAQKTSTSHVARPTTITAVMISNPARSPAQGIPPFFRCAAATREGAVNTSQAPAAQASRTLGQTGGCRGAVSMLPFRAAGPVPGRVRGDSGGRRSRASTGGDSYAGLPLVQASRSGVGSRPPPRVYRAGRGHPAGRGDAQADPDGRVALLPITVAR